MKLNLFFISLAAAVLWNCSSFPEEDPESTFSSNTLRPTIKFNTSDSLSVSIEYWSVNKPSDRKKSKKSFGRNHEIQLVGLKPETQYSYQVIESPGKASKTYQFTTGQVPAEVLRVKKDLTDSMKFNGYILLRRYFKSGADVMLDSDGDIVWYHLYDIPVRRAFAWTKQKTIISIYDTARIQEVDLWGNTILDIDLEKQVQPLTVNHEIFYAADDNIIAVSTDSLKVDLSFRGIREKKLIKGSGIVKLDKEGKILWRWSLLKNTEYKPLIQSMANVDEILGHANSIAVAMDGNYLVSFRDFNQIWKIDKTNGNVIWKLGRDGDFKMPEESYFIRQHSLHINQQGQLVMFDNGDLKLRPNSRIVSLEIDEDNRSAKLMNLVILPRSLSSYRMCSAYSIELGKYLVCTSRKDATIAIVNDSGKILWKVVGDNSSYRAYYLQNPFDFFE